MTDQVSLPASELAALTEKAAAYDALSKLDSFIPEDGSKLVIFNSRVGDGVVLMREAHDGSVHGLGCGRTLALAIAAALAANGGGMSKAIRHRPMSGNCWERARRCRKDGCQPGDLCDVCHAHSEPRGECSECPRCEACDHRGQPWPASQAKEGA